jgi:hypothetical protein
MAMTPACDRQALRPRDRVTPPAPDYSLAGSWAALPDRDDAADITPRGAVDRQATAPADVFFVHPTTYLLGSVWNADLADADVNHRTDVTAIRNQASVFNSAGRVYAPRYRQAVLYAYTNDDPESLTARELAYLDVERAFDHYLARYRNDRPFILAGHSQGAHHLLRLLEERIAGAQLASDLVAAFLVGAPMPADKLTRTLEGIPLCGAPEQTGCLVSWNTVATNADRERFGRIKHQYPTGWETNEGKKLVCSNPLSWTPPIALAAVKNSRQGSLERAPGPPSAHCDRGLLAITRPPGRAFRLTRGRKGDYHDYDLPLFHMNVRRNAVVRVASYLASRN